MSDQVKEGRPTRLAAIQSVHNAVFAGETAAQRKKREAAALCAQEKEAAEEAMQKALEKRKLMLRLTALR